MLSLHALPVESAATPGRRRRSIRISHVRHNRSIVGLSCLDVAVGLMDPVAHATILRTVHNDMSMSATAVAHGASIRMSCAATLLGKAIVITVSTIRIVVFGARFGIRTVIVSIRIAIALMGMVVVVVVSITGVTVRVVVRLRRIGLSLLGWAVGLVLRQNVNGIRNIIGVLIVA